MANDKRKTTVMDKIADNPGMVTVAGAVVGASVAAAGAFAMKDDKTRAKIEKVFDTLSEKVGEYAENMKNEATSQLETKTSEAVGDVKKIVEDK